MAQLATQLQALIDDIDRRIGNTKYTGPRQVNSKMLVSHLKGHAAGVASHHAVRRSVFKHHARGFHRLSPDDVAVTRRKASAFISDKVKVLADDRQHVMAQPELPRIQQRETRKEGLVNHMDNVRFGPAEFLKFPQLWSHYPTRSSMKQLQPQPNPMAGPMIRLFEAEMEKLSVVTRSRPDWLSTVVNNREEFLSVGFLSDTQHPDASVLYVPLLAMGQTHRVVFLKCHLCRGADRLADVRNYQSDDLVFVSESQVPFPSGADAWVVPVRHFRSMNVHAMGQALPFWVFFCFMQTSSSSTTASRARTPTRGPTDPEIFALLQHEFPC